MKFFVDTADIAEIRDLAATGLVDGVTTNPSLVAKSGRKFLDVVKEICDVVPGPGQRRGDGARPCRPCWPKAASSPRSRTTSSSRCR